MRHVVIAVCLALGLAGCTTYQKLPAGSVDQTVKVVKVVAGAAGVKQETIAKVQSEAVKYCGFLPYAKTIRDIFASGKLTSTFEVAEAVCSAVENNPMAEGPGKRAKFGRVGKVPVKGRFVK